MMLDEKALRRPDFQEESSPIILDDGQEWFFPKPSVALKCAFSGGRSSQVVVGTTWGPEFDNMVAAIGEDGQDPSDVIHDVLNLGAYMLLKNYDLPDESLQQLFVYRLDRPDESMQMISSIMDVARGSGPKV